MVRQHTMTTFPSRIRRRRLPSTVSKCWLLASFSSCQSFSLSQVAVSFAANVNNRGATTRVFSTKNSGNRHICVLSKDEDYKTNRDAVAQQVAESLDLPLLTTPEFMEQQADEGFTHVLCLEDYLENCLDRNEQYALAIQPTTLADTKKSRRNSKKKLLPKINPFWIDLCPATPSTRSGQPDLLLQAVAPQRIGGGAVVYDLTAGWAQDSLLLANGGASKVCMVERDPVVACLLRDALRRLKCISQSGTASSSWQQRAQKLEDILSLQVGDAREILSRSAPPDILYLDPMFPPRTKTAAVKKGMQILHGLLETNQVTDDDNTAIRDEEEAELLKLSFQCALAKVVVKRPSNAPVLGGDQTDLKPSHTVKGSINRWDIYVKG